MLRSTLILFTAVLSKTVLKMSLKKHHYFALSLICIGLTLVGVASLDNDDHRSHSKSDTAVVGIFVLVLGQAFGAAMYVIEEKFMQDYEDMHPLLLVGFEGLWGTLLTTLMLIAFQFIPCSNADLCNKGVIENSYFALLELGSSSA